jgi:hypothetical protein
MANCLEGTQHITVQIRHAHKILVGKPEGKYQLNDLARHRRKDNIKLDYEELYVARVRKAFRRLRTGSSGGFLCTQPISFSNLHSSP